MKIKVIIGLGNPGPSFASTRHNIGFRVVDALANACAAPAWRLRDKQEVTTLNGLELIKPHTFMNSSGLVIPALLRRGITAAELLVVHDELELPFGTVNFRLGGSAKGHNGLKSIIAACGPDFYRVRCGIGRPEQREEVPTYVLAKFSEPAAAVEDMIQRAVALIREKV